MRTILVEVKTDYDDSQRAAESVRGAMVRAGYDVEDVFAFNGTDPKEATIHAHGLVLAVEPDLRTERY